MLRFADGLGRSSAPSTTCDLFEVEWCSSVLPTDGPDGSLRLNVSQWNSPEKQHTQPVKKRGYNRRKKCSTKKIRRATCGHQKQLQGGFNQLHRCLKSFTDDRAQNVTFVLCGSVLNLLVSRLYSLLFHQFIPTEIGLQHMY